MRAFPFAALLLFSYSGCFLFHKEKSFPGAKEGHLVLAVDRTSSLRHHDPKDTSLNIVGRLATLLPPNWRVSEFVLTDEVDWAYRGKVIKSSRDRYKIYKATREEPEGVGELTGHLPVLLRQAADDKSSEKHLFLLTDTDPSLKKIENLIKQAKKSGVKISSIAATQRTENPGLTKLATETDGVLFNPKNANDLTLYKEFLHTFWPSDRLFSLLISSNKPFSLPPSCYRLILLTENAFVESFRVITPRGKEVTVSRSTRRVTAFPRKPTNQFDVITVEEPQEGVWQPLYRGTPRARCIFAVMPFRVIVTWRPLKKGAKEVVLTETKPVSAKEGDVVLLSVKIVPDEGVEKIKTFLRKVAIERISVIPVGGGEETEIPFTLASQRKPGKETKKGKRVKETEKGKRKSKVSGERLSQVVSVEWPIYVRERGKVLFDVIVHTRMKLEAATWVNTRRFRMRLTHAKESSKWLLVEQGVPRKVKRKVKGKEVVKTEWEWHPLVSGSTLSFAAVWKGRTAGPVRLRFTNRTALPLQLRGAEHILGVPQTLSPRQQTVVDVTVPTHRQVPNSLKINLFADPQKPGQKPSYITDYLLGIDIPVAQMKLPSQPIEIVWPSSEHAEEDAKDGCISMIINRSIKGGSVYPAFLPIRVERFTTDLKGLSSVTITASGGKIFFSAALPQNVKDGEYSLTTTLIFSGKWRNLGRKILYFRVVVNRDPDVELRGPTKVIVRKGEPIMFDITLIPKRLPMPWSKILVTGELLGVSSQSVFPLAKTAQILSGLTTPLRLRLVGFPVEDLPEEPFKAKLVVQLRYLNHKTTIEKQIEIIPK